MSGVPGRSCAGENSHAREGKVLRETERYWVECRTPAGEWSCWSEPPAEHAMSEFNRLRGLFPDASWRFGRTIERVEVLDSTRSGLEG